MHTNEANVNFARSGVGKFEGAVDGAICDTIALEFEGVTAGARIANPTRTILDLIKATGPIGQLAISLAGSAARPVRILAFDKSPERNWKLGWHQDRVIAVRKRIDTPGFDNWTNKAGVTHVEPPQDVLMQMFSLRLHLDDCCENNGPLKVIPGTWSEGRVEKNTILSKIASSPITTCTARRGDVLAMRALTFHASDAAATPTRRRVLHVDYATCELPGDLNWSLTLDANDARQ